MGGLRGFEAHGPAQLGAALVIQALQHRTGMLAQPSAETRNRRQRGKGAQPGKFSREGLHHMLDE